MTQLMTESADVSSGCVQAGGAGRGKITCDNVKAVGRVQDLLQPDHVGVLRQHTHDAHLLHDILYYMPRRFPHLVLHSVG